MRYKLLKKTGSMNGRPNLGKAAVQPQTHHQEDETGTETQYKSTLAVKNRKEMNFVTQIIKRSGLETDLILEIAAISDCICRITGYVGHRVRF
ncbi:MAG: hypothetical protein M1275_02105 [Patescibacteria group bacterium]|nr:hypothetical protein [Patescibacteria group bacterium]